MKRRRRGDQPPAGPGRALVPAQHRPDRAGARDRRERGRRSSRRCTPGPPRRRSCATPCGAPTRSPCRCRCRSRRPAPARAWPRRATAPFMVEQAQPGLTHPAFGEPRLGLHRPRHLPPDRGAVQGHLVVGPVVERAGVCDAPAVVAGRCPTAAGRGPLHPAQPGAARRQDRRHRRGRAGGVRDVEGGGIPPVLTVTGRRHLRPGPGRVGLLGRPAVLLVVLPARRTSGPGVRAADRRPGLRRARARRARPDHDVHGRRARPADRGAPGGRRDAARQIRRLHDTTAGYLVTTDSQLPAALARADDGRELVRIAAPLAVTQLVLLELVDAVPRGRLGDRGAVPRARAGEAARADRPADPAVRAGRGVPAAADRGAAGHAGRLPRGTRVGPPGLRPGHRGRLHLAGAAHRARSRSRAVWSPPRCPPARCSAGRSPTCCAGCRRAARRQRGAGLIEGVVWCSALAGVVQLVSDRGGRPSPVALLGPGMVAVAGGLLAARLLVRVARRRTACRWPAAGPPAPSAGPASRGAPAPPGSRRCSPSPPACCWSACRPGRSPSATGSSAPRPRPAPQVVLQVRAADPRALLDAVRAADPDGGYAMAAVQVTTSAQEPQLLAVDATRADRVLELGRARRRTVAIGARDRCCPSWPTRCDSPPGRLAVTVDLQELDSPSPLRLTARLDEHGTSERVELGQLRPGRHTYQADAARRLHRRRLPAGRAGRRPPGHRHRQRHRDPADRVGGARAGRRRCRRAAGRRVPGAERVAARGADPRRRRRSPSGRARPCGSSVRTPGGPFAEIVRGDSPEPLPALVGRAPHPQSAAEGGAVSPRPPACPARRPATSAAAAADYVPRAGDDAVLVDLELALRLDDDADQRRPAGLAVPRRPGRGAGAAGVAEAGRHRGRRPRRPGGGLERVYAGDGAVLALRLLLVCGAAAVVVAVGALLVAAYVGRRQRAYEVAALRVVGAASPYRPRPAAARERRHRARRAGVRGAGRLRRDLGGAAGAAAVRRPVAVRRGALRARRRRGLGRPRRSRPAPRRGRPRGRRPAAAHRSPRPPERGSADDRHPGVLPRAGAHLPAGGQRRRRAVRRRPRRRRRRGGRPARPVRARASRRCSTCSPGCCGRAPAGSPSARTRSPGWTSAAWPGCGPATSASCCRARCATCCPTPTRSTTCGSPSAAPGGSPAAATTWTPACCPSRWRCSTWSGSPTRRAPPLAGAVAGPAAAARGRGRAGRAARPAAARRADQPARPRGPRRGAGGGRPTSTATSAPPSWRSPTTPTSPSGCRAP